MPAVVDVGHHRAQLDIDAKFAQFGQGFGAQLLTESRQHLIGTVQKDHPGAAIPDRAEVPLDRAAREFGDLTGHLHPGRPGTDHDEGEISIDILPSTGTEFGQFEGTEDPSPEFQGVVDVLHARCELGEVIVAEVRLSGTCRHDQRVVRRGARSPEQFVCDVLRRPDRSPSPLREGSSAFC